MEEFLAAVREESAGSKTLIIIDEAIREQLEWVVIFILADWEDLDIFTKKYLPEEKREEVVDLLEKKKSSSN